MVQHLADRLIERYALKATRVLDPFCGSGAILAAAKRHEIPSLGIDINPISEVYVRAKLSGFDGREAAMLADQWILDAKNARRGLPVKWPAKGYWFSAATIEKFERLRWASQLFVADTAKESYALLMSYALSVRLCSRADQRSPKPFISQRARKERGGKHYDPYATIQGVLLELVRLYSHTGAHPRAEFIRGDIVAGLRTSGRFETVSHVLTSPPYINAQDYFRNFKLELHLMEGMMDFRVEQIRDRFVGRERGNLLKGITRDQLRRNRTICAPLKELDMCAPRLSAVVHRYMVDMESAFDAILSINPSLQFVIVCGDNLVGGIRIRTWRMLELLLRERGLKLADRFVDKIHDRLLPPARLGHKGLIKEEVVSLYSPK